MRHELLRRAAALLSLIGVSCGGASTSAPPAPEVVGPAHAAVAPRPEPAWILEARDASACVPGAMLARLREACGHSGGASSGAARPAASGWHAREVAAVERFCQRTERGPAFDDVIIIHYWADDVATALAVFAEAVDALIELDEQQDNGERLSKFIDTGPLWSNLIVEPSGLLACQQRVRERLVSYFESRCRSPGFISGVSVLPPRTHLCRATVDLHCQVEYRDAASRAARGDHARALAIYEKLAFDPRSWCPALRSYADEAVWEATQLGSPALADGVRARTAARFPDGVNVLWPEHRYLH